MDKPHARDTSAATYGTSCAFKLLQAQVICLITKHPQNLLLHPGEAQKTQVLTNRGCTREKLLMAVGSFAY